MRLSHLFACVTVYLLSWVQCKRLRQSVFERNIQTFSCFFVSDHTVTCKNFMILSVYNASERKTPVLLVHENE